MRAFVSDLGIRSLLKCTKEQLSTRYGDEVSGLGLWGRRGGGNHDTQGEHLVAGSSWPYQKGDNYFEVRTRHSNVSEVVVSLTHPILDNARSINCVEGSSAPGTHGLCLCGMLEDHLDKILQSSNVLIQLNRPYIYP